LELLSWSDLDFVNPIFTQVLYENIDSTIFDVSEIKDIEELEYITLYIYYEIFNNCKELISVDDSKNHYLMTYKGFLSEERYDEYINDLYQSNSKSYIEYREHLTEQNLIERERDLRSVLADLIENHYKENFIFVLYDVWRRLNEIRVNEKLHYEIISLSKNIKKSRLQ